MHMVFLLPRMININTRNADTIFWNLNDDLSVPNVKFPLEDGVKFNSYGTNVFTNIFQFSLKFEEWQNHMAT